MSALAKVLLTNSATGAVLIVTGSAVVLKNAVLGADVTLAENPAASGVYQLAGVTEGRWEIWVDGVNSNMYVTVGKLDGTGIKDDAIDTNHIADDAVTINQMADNSVGTNQLVNANVTLVKMAANSVDSDQYVDLSIDTVHIGDAQVTKAKMAANSVAEASIEADAVVVTKIKNGEITLVKLNSNAYAEAATVSVLAKRTADGSLVATSQKAETAEVLGTVIKGLLTRKYQIVTSGPLVGLAQIDVTFTDTASGDKVIGVLIRTDKATGQNWSAAYLAAPSNQVICSGAAAAANTKVKKMYAVNTDTDLLAASAVIRLTADAMTWGDGTFTCLLFFESLTDMADVGV